MKELELYVHIPFCAGKCLYCDFLSGPQPEKVIGRYLRQLHAELAACGNACRMYEVSSVFVGGGTPSLLAGRQIEALLETVWLHFTVRADAEITMECNPGTLTREKIKSCKRAGINRLSIGLQSADDAELRLLGRIHTFGQFLETYGLVREMGFKNVNIDIMSALPGQTTEAYEKTLRQVLAAEPEHISAYSLMIEEGTPFYGRYHAADERREKGLEQTLLPSEEEERRMYGRTAELLGAAGYARYEISNYAKEGYACRHNIGYWTRKDYLGVGLGAASLVGNARFRNPSGLQAYLQIGFGKSDGEPLENRWHEDTEYLSVQSRMEEFMFLGLRMTRGVSAADFAGQFGAPLERVYGNALQKLTRQGLLAQTEGGYRLTEEGIAVSNYALAEFLLPDE